VLVLFAAAAHAAKAGSLWRRHSIVRTLESIPDDHSQLTNTGRRTGTDDEGEIPSIWAQRIDL
jgi:uncharacterized protein YbaA (DUF1428 family)